jgi:biopolymer transport protein ExbB/TolQ
MHDQTYFSESSPKSLGTIIFVSLLQLDFVILLVLGAIPIALLFQLTYPRSTELISKLSILIHPLILWGVWSAAREICQIKIDHAIALVVEEKAVDELRLIKNSEKERVAIENIKQDILPNNPYDTAMMRLFHHILIEAQDHKFDSIGTVMQPYREESLGAIFKLQTIQKIALQLGILGTFVGLISALPQLRLNDSDMIKIIDLEPLVNSLYISFSTSVAGLEVSVLLGGLTMLIRKKQNAYFASMESAAIALMSLARNAINKDDFFMEFSQIRTFVQQLSERIYDQAKEIEFQTTEIKNGLSKLTGIKSDFYEFLEQISQINHQFISQMKDVYNVLSPRIIARELQKSLGHATDSIADGFNANLSGTLGQLNELNSAVSGCHKSLTLVDAQMKRQMDEVQKSREEIEYIKSELYDSLKQMSDTQTELMLEIQGYSMEKISKRIEDSIVYSGNKISLNLADKLEKIPREVSTLNQKLNELCNLTDKMISQKLVGTLLSKILFPGKWRNNKDNN